METIETKIRLQKFLADCGICSRRTAENLMLEGRVTVNEVVANTLGMRIDPAADEVKVDGMLVGVRERFRYILLYKPTGYICSVKDERGRRTVLDLLPNVQERVYPVGRLDYNTSGLLLLTNDGALTEHILHPSHKVAKTYQAYVQGIPTRAEIKRLEQGVQLDDGVTAPAIVRLLRKKDGVALIELTIHEGRNRQVRRMLETVHHPVLRLKRVRLSFLNLAGLLPGQWRDLTKEEIDRLKQE